MKRFIQEMYVKKQLLLYDHDRFCLFKQYIEMEQALYW